MHPILVATYIMNLLFIQNVFGFLGLFVTLLGSMGLYYLMSKGAGDNRKFWANVLALALGHAAGLLAISVAPWAMPAFTAVAIIMELFVVAIFSMIGKN